MAIRNQLEKLATERNTPCVTISLNTHRTHPDNLQDEIVLKNLLKEAEDRVINEFGKRDVASLLEKIQHVTSEIDVNHNLDSLHIFLSNDTEEIVKSTWETSNSGVHISESFAVRSLIKDVNRSESYLIMLLSQSGVHLYEAVNDGIVAEIKNDDFPFSQTRHYNTFPDKGSDPKHLDDLLREYFNKVDKALVKVSNETGLQCLVICTEDNYSHLQHVADKPSIYIGYAAVDYNKVAPHQIVLQAWEIVKEKQSQHRAKLIDEMKEAVAQGKVLTDLQEIYQASIDGRGDLLIVHQDFSQPVLMTGERTFDLIEDVTVPNAIDDITSTIAWEVLSKNGNVVFTAQDEIKDLGKIVLKTRY
ncbi:baeRF3 domain-containing protein [Chryseobacterium sp. CT-SW4]|uniref:baeRF3 domain-containing protein n=1 Tax=Chryseobacterium sp. SW-1 TaxID=3157343 RepID=UPI003B011096